MRRPSFVLFVALCALAASASFARPAAAIPIFAQRYHLECGACHSVLPELNAFGNAFRDRGYRVPGVPKHGTTVLALREQISWAQDPAPGARRIVPAGIVLAQGEVGAVEAFLHDNLGSQGGPSAPYLAYLAGYDAHAKLLLRGGLVELPLVHSPAQRNDTLDAYGYEGQRVGLNDLLLIQPRLGIEAEHPLGAGRLFATYAIGEYQGAAYGGKPIDTGVTTRAARPEVGLFGRFPLAPWATAGFDALDGSRLIFPSGRPQFVDRYRRFGANLALQAGRFDLLAQQWNGHDDDADGFGGAIASNGGYVRLRYAPTPHAFVGVRYDAAAAPTATRSYLPYLEFHVTRHARLLLQDRFPVGGGPSSLQGALTIGLPWPRGK